MSDIFYRYPEIQEVGRDIFKCKFLTPEGCDLILGALKEIGEWIPEKQDTKYFTQDIKIKEKLPSVYDLINDRLDRYIFPTVAVMYGLDTRFELFHMFAIRYSMDTQTSLALHHDQSYISASVKLNDDYEGAVLEFPKQEYDNSEVGLGDIILWPGDITHPHQCTELLSNEKHALTIWTKPCGKY